MMHFAFVKSGLENNWGAVYAIATESIDEARNAMQRYELIHDIMKKKKKKKVMVVLL